MSGLRVVRALVLAGMAGGCAAGPHVPNEMVGSSKRSDVLFALETVAEVAAKTNTACPGRTDVQLQSLIEATNNAPERIGRKQFSVQPGSKVFTYLETWAEMIATTPEMSPRRIMWLGSSSIALGVDEESAFQFARSERLERGRIGVQIGFDTHGLFVRRVVGELTETAGVRVGDRVLSIDGQNTALLHPDDASLLLLKGEGPKARVTVVRNGQMLEAEVQRVFPDLMLSGVVQDNVLVLTIPHIDGNATKMVGDLIEEAWRKQPGIAGYVLDLRENSGGLFDDIPRFADAFMEDGVIFSQAQLRGCDQTDFETKTYTAKAGDVTRSKPIVLLIGPRTASGAEMFAAAMMESGRAKSVGQRTFGDGRVQTVIPLKPSTGAFLRISTSEIVTPRGRFIDGEGVTPTFEVSPDEDAVARAIELIAGR